MSLNQNVWAVAALAAIAKSCSIRYETKKMASFEEHKIFSVNKYCIS
jgi:hypothetical protein